MNTYTPKTDLEQRLAEKVSRASFLPYSTYKRFAQAAPGFSGLSDRGRRFLAVIAHRYRRQYSLTNAELDWISEWLLYEEWSEPPMPAHFTKNTIEAKFWCNPCGKETLHRVDSGRRGPCLDCLAKREHPTIPGVVEKQPEQLTLMDVYGVKDIG